jgi:hypothetical protein
VLERVGGVNQVRNGVWCVLLCGEREVGVSIYRCGSKTSRWAELFCVGSVETPLGPVQSPTGQTDSQSASQTSRLQFRLVS